MGDRQFMLRPPAPDTSVGTPALPRVLVVGRAGASSRHVIEKWRAVARRMRLHVLTEADQGSDMVRAIPPRRLGRRMRPLFYARLPIHLVRELRDFRPHVMIAQSPYEGAVAHVVRCMSRSQTALIVEVHGDWRTAARDYGSPWRRLAAPFADRVAQRGLRSADAVRAVGPSMARLAQQVTSKPVEAEFPTYFEAESFFSTPPVALPADPQFLWVGALQRYKNPEMLASAWDLLSDRFPNARLLVIGEGPLQPVVDALVSRHPRTVSAKSRVTPSEVSACLDDAIALVLPSRSEGLPRVAIEAFARGRPVIATRAGGIPDVVVHERNGLLVPSGDPAQLADAMARLVSDRDLVERLGRSASETAQSYRVGPDAYAGSLFSLVQSTILRSHSTA